MKDTFWCRYEGCWYFRILGYGLHWKDVRRHPPSFSECHGFRPVLVIGCWRFEVLTP